MTLTTPLQLLCQEGAPRDAYDQAGASEFNGANTEIACAKLNLHCAEWRLDWPDTQRANSFINSKTTPPMKTTIYETLKTQKSVLAGLVLPFPSTLNPELFTLHAQGRLNDGGKRANTGSDISVHPTQHAEVSDTFLLCDFVVNTHSNPNNKGIK